MTARTKPAADSGQRAVDRLVGLLDLEALETCQFRGAATGNPDGRLFGGHVAAQALAAAGGTVDSDRLVHSLHAYFLAPGRTRGAIDYTVERLRDGRSVSARRVTALQAGATLFTLSASFAVPRPGQAEHQGDAPDTPEPETLPTLAQYIDAQVEHDGLGEGGRPPSWWIGPYAFDIRYVPATALPDGYDQCLWIRADGAVARDATLQACLLTYFSDMSLISSVLAARGDRWEPGKRRLTSMDHAVWFHRGYRVDDWLLYAQYSPSSAGGHGLACGRIYARDGSLIASVTQQGVVATG